ncbi:MAG: hypothetical protein ACMG6S_11665 [Byssovorax sp.]
MSATPRFFGLVVEGPSDARTIPNVVDRILVHEVTGLEGSLKSVRTFGGLAAGSTFLAWRGVNHEAKGRVPRKHGPFSGAPAVEDARTAWYALQCFVGRDPQPDAVFLVRDSDGKQDERRKGLEQARDEAGWPFPVLIGVAHTMMECWVLSAFVPQDKKEIAALAASRKELGFDPTVRSDELTALNKVVQKRPKQVLSKLTEGDEAREAQCWQEANIEHLRARGAKNGLADFLGQVEDKLLPLAS